MKYFLFAFLLFALFYVTYSEVFNKNIGTTLFSESDIIKTCWSKDDLALLASRKVFQDLLPSEETIDITNDLYIHNMIEYFKIILESVRKSAYGKSKHIILLALADTLGGYMHFFLLPVTRHSYYSGFIGFESVEKLYSLFNELKTFLKTNGIGWNNPTGGYNNYRNIPVTPYAFPEIANQSRSCENVIYYDGLQNSHGDPDIIIPMPYFDSQLRPTAIAVPFKRYSLRNVESKGAAYILVKYYVAAIRCLEYKGKNQETIQVFQRQFKRFLRKEVIPRLNDDKFYAAFGGIHRLMLNLKDCGEVGGSTKQGLGGAGYDIGEFQLMPQIQKAYINLSKSHTVTTDSEALEQVVHGCAVGKPWEKLHKFHHLRLPKPSENATHFIVGTLLIALLIWVFLGTGYLCFKMFIKAGQKFTLPKPMFQHETEEYEEVLEEVLEDEESLETSSEEVILDVQKRGSEERKTIFTRNQQLPDGACHCGGSPFAECSKNRTQGGNNLVSATHITQPQKLSVLNTRHSTPRSRTSEEYTSSLFSESPYRTYARKCAGTDNIPVNVSDRPMIPQVPQPTPRNRENLRNRREILPTRYNFQYDLEDSSSVDSSPSPIPTPRPKARSFAAKDNSCSN